MKNISKILTVILCLAFLTTWGLSTTNIYVFGKGKFNFETEGDYVEGENDFSNTAAYNTYGVGVGLVSGGSSFFGIEIHYNMPGTTTLTDTSDNDTVEIDTYQAVAGMLTFGFNIVNSAKLRFYLQLGGGGAYAMGAETKTYTSSLGFETLIEPPDTKFAILGFGGAGVQFFFSEKIGVMGSVRYQYTGYEDAISSIVALGGIVFSF